MGIPNPQAARYNSFQEFLANTKGKDNSPSFTNLFSVRFSTPNMMRSGSSGMDSNTMQVEGTDLDWMLDYYAKNVNLPSKQITTGQTPYVGAPLNMQLTLHIVRSISPLRCLALNIRETSLKGGQL